ncbi:hypothetical protein HYY74_06665 [Candidatus Woesearchaeota archaeon]|nr:hypothetical protein [Candidatus Woesearchaeota archaeon]
MYLLLASLAFLAVAAYSADGAEACCLNPNAIERVCASTEVSPSECCPSPPEEYPRFYSDRVQSPAACRSAFFKESSCAAEQKCAVVCCCPEGTKVVKALCERPGQAAVEPVAGKTCSVLCGEVTPPEGVSCTPNLVLLNVQGQRFVRLLWSDDCAADSFNIERCTGVSCTDFAQLATARGTSYSDRDQGLRWGQVYNYRVTASKGGQSFPAVKSINTGDLTCWGRAAGRKFCISAQLYSQAPFKPYIDEVRGAQSFDEYVSASFRSLFNSAGSCDFQNRLTTTQCAAGTQCAPDSSIREGYSCVRASTCSLVGRPFGLFATRSSCEAAGNYCFYDKSKSTANACYDCSPQMSCYDYKSGDACTANNCRAGNCQWKPTYDEIGAGVCIDSSKNNCQWLDSAGTQGVRSAYNSIFDAPSSTKLAALSTPLFDCTRLAADCPVDCTRLAGQAACSSHSAQSKDSSNRLVSPPDSFCGLNVCRWIQDACKKDADFDQAADCSSGQCEADFYPPSTSFRQGSNYLQFSVFDRVSKESYGGYVTGAKVFFCSSATNTPCTPRELPSYLINIPEAVTAKTLSQGRNFLFYYAQDRNKNLEIIKTAEIFVEVDPRCGNSGQDNSETDVDCGGQFCARCPPPQKCGKGSDCTTGYCNPSGQCAPMPPQSCFNEVKDPGEVGLNCGGPCPACPIDTGCGSDGDCVSGYCNPDSKKCDTRLVPCTNECSEGVKRCSDGKVQACGNYDSDSCLEWDSGASCASDQLCNNGVCSAGPECSQSRSCTGGKVCSSSGTCVACDTTANRCPAGQECRGGSCVVPCDSNNPCNDAVKRFCVGGYCVQCYADQPCTGGKVCENNECLPECGQGRPACTGGKICNSAGVCVSPGDLGITLVSPRLGVTSGTPYNLVVATSRSADCKYSFTAPRYADMTASLTLQSGTINYYGISLNSVGEGFVYVGCRAADGALSEQRFSLAILNTNATITLTGRDTSSYPVESSISVVSDQDVQCRFTKRYEDSFVQMSRFAGYDEDLESAYKKAHVLPLNVEPFTDLRDGFVNVYTVQCMNKVGNLSMKANVSILANSTIPIALVEPRFGALPSVPYTLRVTTNQPASCRYDFLQTRYERMANRFAAGSSGLSHSAANVQGIGSGYVRVGCSGPVGKVNVTTFDLELVSGEPSISVAADDVTDTFSAEVPLLATATVTSTQKVVCRYSKKADAAYAAMTQFEGSDESSASSYKASWQQDITDLVDEAVNSFTFQCMNKVGTFSNKVTKSIDVNTKAPFGIVSSYSDYYRTRTVSFGVRTTKKASCTYTPGSGQPVSFGEVGLAHSASLELQDGLYAHTVDCTSSSGQSASLTKRFVVDTTPPSTPTVTIEAVSGQGISAGVGIRGTWSSSDAESGIQYYEYSVYYANNNSELLAWTRTAQASATMLTIISDNHLIYAKVRATNRGGLVSAEGRSGTLNPCPSGQCVAPPACSQASPCQEGQVCVDGACVQRCLADTACNSNQRCLNGACSSACVYNSQCSSGQKCVAGVCQAACASDAQCESDKRCIAGLCIPAPGCLSAENCPSSVPRCINNACTTACNSDTQCPSRTKCSSGGACVAVCTSQSDCSSGQQCSNGICSGGSCSTRSDCQNSQNCISGQCTAACASDSGCPVQGTRCIGGSCSSACYSDSHCTGIQKCLNGACIAAGTGCTSDTGCGANQRCYYGACLSECSDSRPCLNSKPCVNGGCVSGCMVDNDCPAGTPRCVNGQCSSSCIFDSNCQQQGQRCVNGVCTAPACASDSQCSNGRCIQGVCVPSPGCGQNSQCPVERRCINGVCSSACISINDCPPNTRCVSGECTSACLVDTNCPDNQRCVNGICQGRSCELGSSQNQCPSGQNCINGVCSAACISDSGCQSPMLRCVAGVCSSACYSNSHCGSGQRCVDGSCVSAGTGCTQDSQCQGGRCVSGACTSACTINSDCPSQKICVGGGCIAGCLDSSQCSQGQRCVNGQCSGLCYDNTHCPAAQRCVNGACTSGCVLFTDCPAGRSCVNGQCIDPNACTPACSLGQVCQNGQCVAECSDGCSPSGSRSCSSDGKVRTCGNYDSDSCLEWDSGTSCASGQACNNGVCSSEPECSASNPCTGGRVCTSAGVCVPCSAENRCPDGRVCDNNGACVTPPSGDLTIALLKPRFGFTPGNNFIFAVGTSVPVDGCRYSLTQPHYDSMTQGLVPYQSITGPNSYGTPLTSLGAGHVYVACKAPGGQPVEEDFALTVLKDNATITLTADNASAIPLASSIRVQSDQDVQCRYTRVYQDLFAEMSGFAGYDEDLESAYAASHEQPVAGLADNSVNVFTVQCVNKVGNLSLKSNITIVANTSFPVYLVEPALGALTGIPYTLAVETLQAASCRYDFTQRNYDLMSQLLSASSSGLRHSVSGLNGIGSGVVHVACRTGSGKNNASTFSLSVISDAPQIQVAAENLYDTVSVETPFISTATVTSNQQVVCRYSKSFDAAYSAMTPFAGSDESESSSYKPLWKQNITDLVDNSVNNYTFQCMNKVGNLSAKVQIGILVNTSAPFMVEPDYRQYYPTRQVAFGARTSKRASCVYSQNSSQQTSFGPAGRQHQATISLAEGRYSFQFTCTSAAGSTATTRADFTVDTTPPSAPSVNGSRDGEVSTFSNRIRASWHSVDNESGIQYYEYSVYYAENNTLIVNWTRTSAEEETVTGLSFANHSFYYVKAKATNNAGNTSAEGRSANVEVELGRSSNHCDNREKDADETGVDCGGRDCRSCGGGGGCTDNEDCRDGYYCSSGACKRGSCSDNVRNGNESDVDCGGNSCSDCRLNATCVQNADCISNYCLFKRCSVQTDSCSNGFRDVGESDVDCGGSCSRMGRKCQDTQTCSEDGDCILGSKCISGRCSSAESSCSNRVKDQFVETDVDCGGSCALEFKTCTVGQGCASNSDCTSGACGDDNKCADSSRPPAPPAGKGGFPVLLLVVAAVLALVVAGAALLLLSKPKPRPSRKPFAEFEPFSPPVQPAPMPPVITPHVREAMLKKHESDVEQQRKDLMRQFEVSKPDEASKDLILHRLSSEHSEAKPEPVKEERSIERSIFTRLRKKTSEARSLLKPRKAVKAGKSRTGRAAKSKAGKARKKK